MQKIESSVKVTLEFILRGSSTSRIGHLYYYGTAFNLQSLMYSIFVVPVHFRVILKAWSPIKDEIEDRRKKDSIHHMKHLEKLRMKAYNYTKEHDTKVYEKFCRDEATTPK